MTPPFVGALPLQIAREAVDEIVGVSEDEIREGMRLLLTRAKLYVEGSGAAAVAALVARKIGLPPGARVVAIVSGGNVDLEKIAALVWTPTVSRAAAKGRPYDRGANPSTGAAPGPRYVGEGRVPSP